MKPAWRRWDFWAWLILAGVPVDLWAWARDWALVDPAYLGLSLAWWPVDALGRLMALRLLMGAEAAPGPTLPRLPSALSAEIRVSLWTSALCLAGLIPGILLLSEQGLENRAWVAAGLALGLLGLIPGLLYALHRMLAPLEVLKGHRAAAALAHSAGLLRGRLKPFLRAAGPWWLAGLACEGLGLALPDPWGMALTPIATALELKALVAGASAL